VFAAADAAESPCSDGRVPDLRPGPVGRPLALPSSASAIWAGIMRASWQACPTWSLVAVVDTAPGRAAEIAGVHGGEALEDWREIRGAWTR
jgi:hypothetical protein